MIGRLLPLRLLRAAAAVASSCSRFPSVVGAGHPPFHLTRHPRSSIPFGAGDEPLGARFFSGVGGARSDRKGALRSRSIAAAGQAKSLIEDEEELSDWISDLKTDSFHLGLSSEDDERDHDRSRSSGRRDKGLDGDRFRSRDKKGDSLGARRKRDNDTDEFSEFSRRGRNQNLRGKMPSRRQRDDDSDNYLEFPNNRQSQRLRGNATSRRQRDEDPDDFSEFSNRKRSQNSRKRSIDSYLEDSEDVDDDNDGFRSSHRSKRVGPSRGGRVSSSSRGGARDVRSGFRQDKGLRSSVLLVSEPEEDEDKEDDSLSSSDDNFFGETDNRKEDSFEDAFKAFGPKEANDGEAEQKAPRIASGDDDSYLSQTRFDECSISPLTLKGIKAAGYERMTVVQEATLPVILKGKDVLAKAKTGTGKTVAFLLPAVEVISKLPPAHRDQNRPPINVLVVCPTRELADQAAAEANKLLKYHPSIGVQVVMGGTRLALEQKRMQTNPCQILVATPGRLRDHIENTPGFCTRLMGVKVLVLDEADRLLDMGFRTDIEKIVATVPKQRQTLLFSATVPDEVRQICYMAMKRDLEFINTVEEGSEETHSQVKQMHLVAPLDKQFPLLYGILKEHIADNVDYKVIVFCTTAMMTKLVADLLSELKLNVREIHSRKPQSYRTRVSKEFKESKGLILVSSDVSARGVDYPNVTLVIQLGVPADREQYIHRLGRTGRRGKEGTGILVLAPWEDFFLSSIKDLPITKAPLPLVDLDTKKKVERALAHVELKNKESAYQAWLGYYNSNKNIGRDKYQLVSLANEFSRSMGLDNPPAITRLVLRKMGLNNVPGLRAK